MTLMTAATWGLGTVGFIAALFALRNASDFVSRDAVARIGAAWIAFLALEYVVLGPHSFIYMDDEGDLTLPYLHFMARYHTGGTFSHALAGGSDAISSYLTGGQIVSIERFLLATLPTWLAVLVHLLLTWGTAFVGAYLVCRRMVGATRLVAVATTVFFTVSHEYLLIHTYDNGTGLAAFPLGVYLCVGRTGRRRYWSGVVAFAAYFSIAAPIVEVSQPLAVAFVVAAIAFPCRIVRAFSALGIVVALALANWADVLYGYVLIAPDTARTAGGQRIVGFADTAKYLFYFLAQSNGPRIAAIWILVLAVLAACRDRQIRPAILAYLAPAAIGTVQSAIPWHSIGLGMMQDAPNYYFKAYIPLLIPFLAMAVERLTVGGTAWTTRFRFTGALRPAVALAGAAFAIALSQKTENAFHLVYHGGQTLYKTIANLAERPWAPKEPYRVVTLALRRYGPDPNIPLGFYGLDAFDAWLNMKLDRYEKFWTDGIIKPGASSGYALSFQWRHFDRKTGHYRLGEQANVPLFGVANVGFILSPLPVDDPHMTLVSSPPSPPITIIRDNQERAAYYRERLGKTVDAGNIYVYALDRYLPRVFVVDAVSTVPGGADAGRVISAVASRKSERTAVVIQEDATTLGAASADLKVENFALIRDGFDIRVDAPSGGILADNSAFQPFWTATSDGTPLRIVPANHIHMVVAVPKGATRIKFAYKRPRLY